MMFRKSWMILVGLVFSYGFAYGAGGDMGGGNGTEVSPYLIEDMGDFDVFCDPCNAGTYWADGVYTTLACDLDLTGTGDNADGSYSQAVIAPGAIVSVMVPIFVEEFMSDSPGFDGVFDGDGHVISHMTIRGDELCGLFGFIGETGVVKELTLESVTVEGRFLIGGLCGQTYSDSIYGCHVSGSVDCGYGGLFCGMNNGRIDDSSAVGSIVNSNPTYLFNMGGFCGENRGWIDDSSAEVSLATDSCNSIGGFCGLLNHGTMSGCWANGQVTGIGGVGGLVGTGVEAVLEDCWSSGDVLSSGAGIFGGTGGLCGIFQGDIDRCWASGDVSGYDEIGGLCGGFDGAMRDCYAKGTVNAANGLVAGGLLGSCGGTVERCYATGDVSSRENVGGLIGQAGSRVSTGTSATILNCWASGDVSGSMTAIGGFIGLAGGAVITDSFALGSITPGSMMNTNNVGGFCGEANSSNQIKGCFAAGDVEVNYYAGGFCGNNSGHIERCIGMGAVQAETLAGGFCGKNRGVIEMCYSTGSVEGGDRIGAFCGDGSDVVVDCFWDVDSSGIGVSGDVQLGAVGKGSPEMRTESTFTGAGWNFVDEWQLSVEGGSLFDGRPEPKWLGEAGQAVIIVEITSPSVVIIEGSYGLTAHLINADMTRQEVTDAGLWMVVSETVPGDVSVSEDGVISVSDLMGPGDVVVRYTYIHNNRVYEVVKSIRVKPVGLTVGDGSAGNPYLIENLVDFNLFRVDPMYCQEGVYVRLMTDLDLAGQGDNELDYYEHSVLFSHNEYRGIFDGNGHVIKNASVRHDFGGGFILSAAYCTIYDLGLVNVDVQGDSNLGGLASYIIESEIRNCYVSGVIEGTENLGGMAWSCSRSTIENCYSVCEVNGEEGIGGLFGRMDNSSCNGCVWNRDLTEVGVPNQETEYPIGKTTAEMKQRQTFVDLGWDFASVWGIGDGQTYPYLRSGLAADIDGDGIVNMADLAVLAGQWLMGS